MLTGLLPATVALACALTYVATAQPHFQLSTGIVPYRTLEEGTSGLVPIPFGAQAREIHDVIGESFILFGRRFTFGSDARLYVRGRGGVTVVSGQHHYSINALLSFYDTTDANARISYAVEGEPGDRTLIVEWRNGRFIDADSGQYVTFQLGLHQSGVVDFHYGPNSLPESYLFPGFAYMSHSIAGSEQYESVYMVAGEPDNPVLIWDTAGTIDIYALNRIPQQGTIFRLTPLPVVSSVPELVDEPFAFVGPVPATDRLIVRLKKGTLDDQTIELININGERVYNGELEESEGVIDVSELPGGIYLLIIGEGPDRQSRTVIVR